MAPELATCLQRVAEGHRFPLKQSLAELPAYNGLKRTAEVNNHLQEGRNATDKFLRSLQQRIIHLMRFQASQNEVLKQSSDAARLLSLKTFTLLAETETLLVRERKRRSLPMTVTSTSNGLFSKEDLAAQREQ